MPDALRADFRAVYRMSIAEMMREDMLETADMAAHLPQNQTSAVFRALNPETWHWGVAEHLAAIQADALRMLIWAKSKDAQRKPPRNQPKPIPRPGVTEKQTAVEGRFKDVEAVPLDELKKRLAAPRSAVK